MVDRIGGSPTRARRRHRIATAAVIGVAVLAVTGCGASGVFAPQRSNPPVASAGSTTPTEPGAASTPSASTEAAPAPPTSDAAAPQSFAPPPDLPLPDVEPPPMSEVPVLGAEPAAGAMYDLYVGCPVPATVIVGASIEQYSRGADCNMFGAAVVAVRGVPGEEARAFMVLEPDIEAPPIVRVPEGTQLDAEAQAPFADIVGRPTTFTLMVSCGESGSEVHVPGSVNDACMPYGWGLDYLGIPAGDPLPEVVTTPGAEVTIDYVPEG